MEPLANVTLGAKGHRVKVCSWLQELLLMGYKGPGKEAKGQKAEGRAPRGGFRPSWPKAHLQLSEPVGASDPPPAPALFLRPVGSLCSLPPPHPQERLCGGGAESSCKRLQSSGCARRSLGSEASAALPGRAPPRVAGSQGSAPGSGSWSEGRASKRYADPGPQALSCKAW